MSPSSSRRSHLLDMVTVTVWGTHGPTIIRVRSAAPRARQSARRRALHPHRHGHRPAVRRDLSVRGGSHFAGTRDAGGAESPASAQRQVAPGDGRGFPSRSAGSAMPPRTACRSPASMPSRVPVFDQSQKMQFAMTGDRPELGARCAIRQPQCRCRGRSHQQAVGPAGLSARSRRDDGGNYATSARATQLMRVAEVGLAHLRMRQQFGAGAAHGDAAAVEHIGAVRQPQRQVGPSVRSAGWSCRGRAGRWMMAKISLMISGASPSDGSSSSSSRGAPISARPIASICCSPPDNVTDIWSLPLP